MSFTSYKNEVVSCLHSAVWGLCSVAGVSVYAAVSRCPEGTTQAEKLTVRNRTDFRRHSGLVAGTTIKTRPTHPSQLSLELLM